VALAVCILAYKIIACRNVMIPKGVYRKCMLSLSGLGVFKVISVPEDGTQLPKHVRAAR
jgi:hypothetical protein